jgi:hypothetical protein
MTHCDGAGRRTNGMTARRSMRLCAMVLGLASCGLP